MTEIFQVMLDGGIVRVPKTNSAKTRQRYRLDVLHHYGGDSPKCAYCGEKIIEFLCIDHIDGGGTKKRKHGEYKGNIYWWLRKHDYPEGFQILCHNCNKTKEIYGNIVRDGVNHQPQALKLKIETFNHYSNGEPKCECCGETCLPYLVLDHVVGGARAWVKRMGFGGHGPNIYLWLRRNKFPPGYRVLCHNCNSAYGYYGYCPHNSGIDEGVTKLREMIEK